MLGILARSEVEVATIRGIATALGDAVLVVAAVSNYDDKRGFHPPSTTLHPARLQQDSWTGRGRGTSSG